VSERLIINVRTADIDIQNAVTLSELAILLSRNRMDLAKTKGKRLARFRRRHGTPNGID